MNYERFDDYFWNNQNCMRNLFNMHNQIELDDMVNDLVGVRMTEMKLSQMFDEFDPNSVKMCHKYLFQDCYDWAGEYRCCPMGRNMDYAAPDEIPDKVNAFCDSFRNDFINRKFKNTSDMGHVLAEQWARLNAIHAFRDGNGRSQFIFFDTACRAKGYELDISRQDLKSLRLARDSASEGRPGLLDNILSRSLQVYDAGLAVKNVGTDLVMNDANIQMEPARPVRRSMFSIMKDMLRRNDNFDKDDMSGPEL